MPRVQNYHSVHCAWRQHGAFRGRGETQSRLDMEEGKHPGLGSSAPYLGAVPEFPPRLLMRPGFSFFNFLFWIFFLKILIPQHYFGSQWTFWPHWWGDVHITVKKKKRGHKNAKKILMKITLDQHYSDDSVLCCIVKYSLLNTIATRHMWLWLTWSVANMTGELNYFLFYLI